MAQATATDRRLRVALDEAALAMKRGSTSVALELLDAARSDTPILEEAALLHHARAQVLLHLGRADDALVAADRACSLAPGMPDLQTNLAAALLHKARAGVDAVDSVARAVRVLEAAVAQGPKTPEVRATLAVALQQQGRAADAVAVCDDNLLRFPGDAPTLFNKAAALKSLGRLAEARSILQALSSSFPPAATALARLA